MRECGYVVVGEIKADDKKNRVRVHGDKKDDLSYRLAIEGDFGFGWFRYHKEGVTHKWYSKRPNMTSAEHAALKSKIDERRAADERDRKALARAVRDKAERVWSAARHPVEAHRYLARKGVRAHGLRIYKGTLVVPAVDDKGISTLQFISAEGEKRFLKGGEKAGAWFTISGTRETVGVCEGYATGASVHEAMGWETAVVFDSGNLKAAIKGIRARYPEAELVICSDDDKWTFRAGRAPAELGEDKKTWPAGDDAKWIEWRTAGMLINPGFEAAQVALKGAGERASIRTPRFDNLTSPPAFPIDKPTDWNDLHQMHGLDAVRAQFNGPAQAGAGGDDDYDNSGIPYPDMEELSNYIPIYEPESIEPPIVQGPFKIMGYNNGKYYYLPRDVGQLIELGPSSHTKQHLMQLAPLEWWKDRFGAGGKVSWDYVSNALIQMCHKRGVFKTDTNLRGAGVWLDKGRVVVHMGNKLLVDGAETDPFEIGSAYVYQKTQRVFEIGETPLEAIDAVKLQKICECCTFTNKLSPILLAGWIVIAPISGALPWRPHIWIDGEAEAGKSWAMNQIVKRTLGNIALRVGAGTTEPGIRRLLGHDSRPIVMDEMEGENEKDQDTLQAILLLARKASSGETIVQADTGGKGTVFYNIYSTFCLSSINSAVKQRADMMRFSHLDLRRNNSPDAAQMFSDLKAFVAETLTEEFTARLFARTIRNIRNLLKNIETFSEAAADVLKTRRAGDQIGPMLAGAYSLHKEGLVSVADAKKWITDNDWSTHTAINEQTDADKMMGHLMTARLSVNSSSRRHETQIGKAITVALGFAEADYQAADARSALETMDIKIKEQHVWIRKPSQHIDKIMRGTPWAVSWTKKVVSIKGISLSKTPQAFNGSSAYVLMIERENFRPEDRLV